MTDLIKPLSHADVERKDDSTLAAEAGKHLTENPPIQLVCELLTKLREMELPWWTPKHLRLTYSASDRMRWLAQRPDLRQRITSQLTGLAPKASRKKAPDFQAALIDSVIDDGDISVEEFEMAFEPADLAVYGPAGDFWRLFRRRMPWDDDATTHQDLIGWLMGALLADKSPLDGSSRKSVLNAWDIRTSIDGRVWHTRVPLDVRVAIDEARFKLQKEKPNEPFHVHHDLAIAAPALIAASIPLKDLTGVLDVAGRVMGFEGDPTDPNGPQRGAREMGRASYPPGTEGLRESRRPEGASSGSVRRVESGADREDKTIVGPTPAAEEPSADEVPPGGAVELAEDAAEGAEEGEDEMEQTNPWVIQGDDAFSAALGALGQEEKTKDRKSAGKRKK